jgi:4-hydroxybenzoate polyprenyltransferase
MLQNSHFGFRFRDYKYFFSNIYLLFDIWKKLFAFLRISSIFTGMTGFFVTFMAFILLGSNPDPLVCFSVFLMVFSVYSLNKLTDMKEDAINMPERVSFIKGRKRLVLSYSLIAYFLSVLLAFREDPSTIPLLFIPLASNALYSIKLIPGIPRFKDIPVMKNLFVALSWTLVCTLMPALYLRFQPSICLLIIIFFIFTKLFINAALYDIRDVKGDRENGIRTMPVLLGTKKTAGVLLILNTTLLPYLSFAGDSIRAIFICLILYGYAYTTYFSVLRSPQLLDFFVDGEWMLASIVLMAIRYYGLLA